MKSPIEQRRWAVETAFARHPRDDVAAGVLAMWIARFLAGDFECFPSPSPQGKSQEGRVHVQQGGGDEVEHDATAGGADEHSGGAERNEAAPPTPSPAEELRAFIDRKKAVPGHAGPLTSQPGGMPPDSPAKCQGSDIAGSASSENPVSAARSDSRSDPEGSSATQRERPDEGTATKRLEPLSPAVGVTAGETAPSSETAPAGAPADGDNTGISTPSKGGPGGGRSTPSRDEAPASRRALANPGTPPTPSKPVRKPGGYFGPQTRLPSGLAPRLDRVMRTVQSRLDGGLYVSAEVIANACNMSVTNVYNALTTLKKTGWLAVEGPKNKPVFRALKRLPAAGDVPPPCRRHADGRARRSHGHGLPAGRRAWRRAGLRAVRG